MEDGSLKTCLDREEPPGCAGTIEDDHIIALKAPGNFVFAALFRTSQT